LANTVQDDTPVANRTRCSWCGDDLAMIAYHDTEWGVPLRDSRALWETLVLDGFQAGLSWRTILHKRAAFRAAFAGFVPDVVARFGEADVTRLMADPGIVRSRAKIIAAIAAARIYCDMAANGEDFAQFVWGIVGGAPVEGGAERFASTPASVALSEALKARGFKFVGPVIVYAWMQAVGMVNDHAPDCFRRAAVRALA
jgi:DNA-3-methyladenine glycosylase I